MVAARALRATTETQSFSAGEETFSQCSPSVVLRMAPARPTIQQTFSAGEEPARSSVVTGDACDPQDWPASSERSIRPPGPKRQSTVDPGAETCWDGNRRRARLR